MQIDTTRFGVVEIDETSVITFPEGLPGFEGYHSYTLIPHTVRGNAPSPFTWMQSLEDSRLAFLIMEPNVIFTDYKPSISSVDKHAVGLADTTKEPVVYTLLTVPKGDPIGITANLMAPIIFNPETHMARQVVLADDRYGLRHRLFIEKEPVVVEEKETITIKSEKRYCAVAVNE